MIVKNWYKLLGSAMVTKNTVDTAQVTMYDGSLAYVRGDYNSDTLTFNASGSSSGRHAALDKTPTNIAQGVVFGDGDTAPTFNDYGLAGNQFTTFTATKSVSYEVTDNGTKITALYTITNTGEEFTIREVCAFATPYINDYWRPLMVERTVLDTPVTIPAGGIGQVTYPIQMNYPTT